MTSLFPKVAKASVDVANVTGAKVAGAKVAGAKVAGAKVANSQGVSSWDPNGVSGAEPSRDFDEPTEFPVRQKRTPGELDMTPMVDVTFLLLIFFMVTASFSMQRSLPMPRQASELPSPTPVVPDPLELDVIELHINESGAFLVLTAQWQLESPGKQNLITALIDAVGDDPANAKLDIRVHENAKLQTLVDAIDSATIAGITEMQLTQVDGDTFGQT